jgi:microcystin-dependent protein
MPYIGEIRAFTGELPRDWLPCDGQRLLMNAHKPLFAAIGTRYGEEQGVYFLLPDLRGRVGAGASKSQPTGSTSGVSSEDATLIPFEVVRWGICASGEFPERG